MYIYIYTYILWLYSIYRYREKQDKHYNDSCNPTQSSLLSQRQRKHHLSSEWLLDFYLNKHSHWVG